MGFAFLQAAALGFSAIVVVIIAIFVAGLLISSIKVVKEYERGVIFRLGRVRGGPKGPGLFILLPGIDRMVKVDLRIVTMDVPPQDVITRDNVPARVNAVIYFRVIDPNRSVLEVENHVLATSQIAQTTLRSVLGQKDLDNLLINREEINEELQRIIDEQTDPWGMKVSVVEVKDVEIPRRNAAGDGPPGRERAREARQDHSGRGRVPGLRAPQAGRGQAGEPAGPPAQALSDDGRDRKRAELHHHPAHPHRPPPPLPERTRRLRRRSRGECAAGAAGGRRGRASLRGGRR